MPSPSSALTTLRPDLAGSVTEFDLAADRAGFIGYKVLPIFEVAKQAGVFGQIPLAQLLQARDLERAPGSGYSRGQFTFTTGSYSTHEYGAEEPVDDREAAMYVDYFKAEVVAAQRAIDAVLREAEKRVAAAIFNTTTWTGSSLTTAVSTPWSTSATATPIADIEAAVRKVWDNTGLWPDTLIISRRKFRDLRLCAEVRARISASGAGDNDRAANITVEQLAEVFDLPKILVAGGAKNTANENQTAAIASIWSNTQAMVCRTSSSDDIREPCLGRTFHWGEDGSDAGGTFESYREESIRADIVRCRHDVVEKVLITNAGHLLTSV